MIDRCSFHHLFFDMAGNGLTGKNSGACDGIDYGKRRRERNDISSPNTLKQLNSFPKMKYPNTCYLKIL